MGLILLRSSTEMRRLCLPGVVCILGPVLSICCSGIHLTLQTHLEGGAFVISPLWGQASQQLGGRARTGLLDCLTLRLVFLITKLHCHLTREHYQEGMPL